MAAAKTTTTNADALTAQTVKAQQANTKLTTTVDELTKIASILTGGAAGLTDLTNQIAQRQADLQQLETTYLEAARSKQVEFELTLKANQLNTVNGVLTSQGKTSIDVSELNKLRTDYQQLSTNFQDELNKQIGVVRGQAEASKAAAIKQRELELQATGAEVKAQISSLTEKNALLAAQVADYKTQITADREAQIKMAQARGNPVVTVASGK